MFKLFSCTLIVLASCSVMLSGCGGKVEGSAKTGLVPPSQIRCIGVLPAAALIKGQSVPVYLPEDKSLQRGVQVMNGMLSQELTGNDKIRFVGIDQIAALELTGGERPLALARMIGESINCNAVLESTVKRFTERVGGRYSVESPASVAFEMRLIAFDTSSILWSAKFDEVQQSVFENILEWNKANFRGFTWITAEELMEEGVSGKLAASSYFNPAKVMDQSESSLEDSL